MPVCGDRATTAILLAVVMPVPTNGEVAKISGLCGAERISARRAETEQEQARQPDAADDVGEDLRRSGSLQLAAASPRSSTRMQALRVDAADRGS